MTPPPPSLSLTLERKRQSLKHGGKDSGDSLGPTNMEDSLQYMTLEWRRQPAVQSHPSTGVLGTYPQGVQRNPSGSGTIDTVVPFSCEPFESGPLKYQDTHISLSQQAHTTKFSATHPTQPSRDAPTPQSLDSSNWSSAFGQTEVATEVDALTTAAAAGDVMKVKSLLADGVDVKSVNTFGRRAIQVCNLW